MGLIKIAPCNIANTYIIMSPERSYKINTNENLPINEWLVNNIPEDGQQLRFHIWIHQTGELQITCADKSNP